MKLSPRQQFKAERCLTDELQPLDETAPGQSGRTSLPFTIIDEKMVNLEIT